MTWIFGYGSLVWRPDFPHAEVEDALLRGWARRFWQGSPDHRGVPEAPGRVLTLVEAQGAECWGRAYRIAEGDRQAVIEALDLRECAGYRLLRCPLELASGRSVVGLVYVAGPENPNFLGPAPLDAMARQVLNSAGASGQNRDYVLELAAALEAMGRPEPQVTELAEAIKAGVGPT